MKAITWATIIFAVIVLGLFSYCSYEENSTSYFSNYQNAKESGIMERGWIPTFIPQSSTEIRETHNLDTNIVRMTFKYSIGDTKEVKENCVAEEISGDIARYKCRFSGNEVYIELYSDGTGKLESQN